MKNRILLGKGSGRNRLGPKWDQVLDDSKPPFYRWFTGGRLNTCFNAVDVHVHRGGEISRP